MIRSMERPLRTPLAAILAAVAAIALPSLPRAGAQAALGPALEDLFAAYEY